MKKGMLAALLCLILLSSCGGTPEPVPLEELPEEFRDIRETEGKERAVCDYIAGMTDAYAVERYQELFIPKAWTVM